MKIATWNVNGLNARMEFMQLWLADRQPDVVGLQEIKTMDEAFPHEFFRELGYEVITHGQKAWNGVAVLSRLPVELVQAGLPGQEERGARFLTARIDDRLDFTTVYCPNGKTLEHDDFPAKLAWFDSLASYWQNQSATAAVLCGDFNIVHHAIDSWHGDAGDGSIFHTPEERARLQALLDLGLSDLYRVLHPADQTYSWWDYRGGSFHRGHGLRIDLILGSAAVNERLVEVHTDRDFRKKQDGLTASDHAPVIAELDL
jgi:exodeoxyribonuclease-3